MKDKLNKNAQKVWLMTTNQPVKHDLKLIKRNKFGDLIVTYYFLEGIEQGYKYHGHPFNDSTKGRQWHIDLFRAYKASYIDKAAYDKAIANCLCGRS